MSCWRLLFLVAVLLFVVGISVANAGIPASCEKYRRHLTSIVHREHGLDGPVSEYAAQIEQESGCDPLARSSAGAVGLGQLMPGTSSWLGKTEPSLFPINPLSPTWSMQAMVRYMRLLKAQVWGPDACSRTWAALRSYNGGLGRWREEAKLARDGSRQSIDAQCGKASRSIQHCRENLTYPKRVLLVLAPKYDKAHWGGSLSCEGEQ